MPLRCGEKVDLWRKKLERTPRSAMIAPVRSVFGGIFSRLHSPCLYSRMIHLNSRGNSMVGIVGDTYRILGWTVKLGPEKRSAGKG